MIKILLGIVIIIISLNIVIASMALGYRIEEKYPNRKSIFERLDSFWIKVWKRIIKQLIYLYKYSKVWYNINKQIVVSFQELMQTQFVRSIENDGFLAIRISESAGE